MPIPRFADTLQERALGPGITVIQGGTLFDDHDMKHFKHLSIAKLNAELAKTVGSDEMVFMNAETPKEDLSLALFLKSQKK